MKRNYPDKFVVESKQSKYAWNVTKDGDEYLWVTVGDNLSIGSYGANYMDTLPETYEFIFPDPEMVFPFYMTNSMGWPFKVVKGSTDGFVKVIARSVDGEDIDNCATVEHCKEMIKGGIWIVTSVGEQKPVETPVEVSNDILALTIKCDTTQPVEAMNALAEAAERVNMALLAMQDIMAGMGLVGQACKGEEFDTLFKFDLA